MKNLGPLCCVLGIEVSYRPGDYLISQQKYIKDLLGRAAV